MITFDTNVLFYALDRRSPEKQAVAQDLIGRALDRPGTVVLSMQVLGELYFSLTRKKVVSREDALRTVRLHMDVFDLIPGTRAGFAKALDAVRDHDLPLWDAVLWADVDAFGCRLLLTEDFQDGRVLGGVRILNPFNPDNRVPLDAALPPVE
ncbi:PIN domain-containing protein [Azospirillum isscasi]|uniref:PIN domain-containing protein n=1 Tax=Azospirillum isscasi TaxID=3053926 RepID=A0ABU0WEP8_9PROT|nr:PIN domain-containing protein [Azospirillum isscasi]MDQ2102665.1 PIN domain-containing protein [Azospirillum isscasi]